jgi:formate dehydrogenase subunit gamma
VHSTFSESHVIEQAASSAGWDPVAAQGIIDAHAALEGATLPILHALQAEFGYIPKQSEAMIASALNLSRAEIHGVISFYHDFRRRPAGRPVLKLCRAEACQSMGSVARAESLLARLGIGWGETTADGALSVESAYCLGLCACAPAALMDGEPVGRLTDSVLAELAGQARAA